VLAPLNECTNLLFLKNLNVGTPLTSDASGRLDNSSTSTWINTTVGVSAASFSKNGAIF